MTEKRKIKIKNKIKIHATYRWAKKICDDKKRKVRHPFGNEIHHNGYMCNNIIHNINITRNIYLARSLSINEKNITFDSYAIRKIS